MFTIFGIAIPLVQMGYQSHVSYSTVWAEFSAEYLVYFCLLLDRTKYLFFSWGVFFGYHTHAKAGSERIQYNFQNCFILKSEGFTFYSP